MYNFKPSTDLTIELSSIGIKHSVRTMYNKMLKGRKSPYYNIEEWAREVVSSFNMQTDDQPLAFWHNDKLVRKELMSCMKERMEWHFLKKDEWHISEKELSALAINLSEECPF